MSSSNTLDPSTCHSVDDAFTYPLPQVRQFHRTLTLDLDSKNARLRTLVGGGYRELLSTAETILQMRKDVSSVETQLGSAGSRCGQDAVTGIIDGLARFQCSPGEGQEQEYKGWSARLRVLSMCAIIVGKLLRKPSENAVAEGEQAAARRNLVTAAKVWVLSELLIKNLGCSTVRRSQHDEAVLKEAKRRSKTSRKRLLAAIETYIGEIDESSDRRPLTQILCAYSLTKRSGARDVLVHFLKVRGRGISLYFEDDEDGRVESLHVTKALRLFTRTISDVQALVPRMLSNALEGIKAHPLLSDPALREIESLRIDVCEQWSGDDLLYFKPYIMHDDLESSHAVAMLKSWVARFSKVLLSGLEKILATIPDFGAVSDLRSTTLALWFTESSKTRGFDASFMLDDIRQIFMSRMVELLKSRISKLHLVDTEVEATLLSWEHETATKTQSLWDQDIFDIDMSNGAHEFRRTVIARTFGRDDAVSRALNSYQTWHRLVKEVTVIIDQLEKDRWDEDIEDMEDEETLQARNDALSKDDPQMLREKMKAFLGQAFETLHDKFATLTDTHLRSSHAGHVASYILRIVRDLRSDLPTNTSGITFGLSLVPKLHAEIAKMATSASLDTFSPTLQNKRVAGRALWEGSPQLPVQPSPAVFKLLHLTALAMASLGNDLWSPTAMAVLKHATCCDLFSKYASMLESAAAPDEIDSSPDDSDNLNKDNATTDPAEQVSEKEDAVESDGQHARKRLLRHELLVQSLFDIRILQCAFDSGSSSSSSTKATSAGSLQTTLDSISGLAALDTKEDNRLTQSAAEYWRRTALLFGPLGLPSAS